jgi:putative transcriptional regulator
MRQTLKQLRIKAGKTQKQIAKAAGISERAYQKVETGESIPRVETAISIAKILDSTVEALFVLPRRKLRENDAQGDSNTNKKVAKCKRGADAHV